MVRFLLPASRRRKRPARERAPYATSTYPAGTARPIALDSLTMLI
jgi:hypothetical protein